MTNEQKRQVKDALVRYVNKFETQTKAAESLRGISSSTISQVKNSNWELLSDRLWHHIARQVAFYNGEWQPADTSAYLLLRILFSDAQHYAMTYGISIGEGLGKTFTAHHYTRENDNIFFIAGNENFNRKSFMATLMTCAGLQANGAVPELLQQLTNYVSEREEPLLVIDDAHKLKDRVLHMVVLLANSLTGKAGIIIMGRDELRTRIIEGVRLKKIGFDEIYKSIGRRFITLGSLGPKDVELVCRANGVYDDGVIKHISEQCDGQADGGAGLHKVAELVTRYGHMDMAA
jgi:AAA domain-containing protein